MCALMLGYGRVFSRGGSPASHSPPVTTLSAVHDEVEYLRPAVSDYHKANIYNENEIIVSKS